MPTVAFHPAGRSLPCRNEFSLLGKLFQTSIRSDSDLGALAEARVGVDVLDRLGARGLKAHALRFIISRRTLSCRRQNGERLSMDESDKAIRLARILIRTEVVFGNRGKALIRLRGKQVRFAGKTALAMTVSEHGARLVEEAPTRIDEGYFVGPAKFNLLAS
ncbi:antitoxin Xre-like helix-turn-helix domain-containing protein [Paraburkholderia sediminicola]|uniref:antitoxin Xre-like helix-turn-helix domain-containing protein n=1 Tax=Paraburkholderia sediminicola TaxID=458836 RepID=UPI0038BB2614